MVSQEHKKTVKYTILNYLKNIYFHGIRYIFLPDNYIFERIFWIFAFATSFWLMLKVSTVVYINNSHDFVNLIFEPYKEPTRFPSVSVCQSNLGNTYSGYLKQFKKQHRIFISNILSPDIYKPVTIESAKEFNILTVQDIAETMKLRLNVSDLIYDCYFNNERFSCADNFLPTLSERTLCFTLQTSISTSKPKNPDKVKSFYTKQGSGPGVLRFRITTDAQVAVHGPEETYCQTLELILSCEINRNIQIYTYYFSKIETKTDPEIEFVSPEIKQCVHPKERRLKYFPLYSYSTCYLECIQIMVQNLCNCSLYFFPYDPNTDIICDLYTVIGCASERLKNWTESTEEVCDCMPSCNEMALEEVFSKVTREKSSNGNKYTEIIIKEIDIPSMRFRRVLARDKIDAVVSIGGLVGLFLGASILSIVELFWFLLVRIWNR